METLTPPDKDSTAQAETTQNMGGVEMGLKNKCYKKIEMYKTII